MIGDDLDNPPNSVQCQNPDCRHPSRDHTRGKKIEGVWTGKCTVFYCDCEKYIPPMKFKCPKCGRRLENDLRCLKCLLQISITNFKVIEK